MTITTDFKQLNQEKDVAELAIKIRADMEYTLRVLEEQIASIEESIKDAKHASIAKTLRTDGANILKKITALRDDLQKNHSEFLTIL